MPFRELWQGLSVPPTPVIPAQGALYGDKWVLTTQNPPWFFRMEGNASSLPRCYGKTSRKGRKGRKGEEKNGFR